MKTVIKECLKLRIFEVAKPFLENGPERFCDILQIFLNNKKFLS